MAKVHLQRRTSLDEFLNLLVDATLSAFEAHRQEFEDKGRIPRNVFHDSFKEVLCEHLEVAVECGLSVFCQETMLIDPFSDEAHRELVGDGKNAAPSLSER